MPVQVLDAQLNVVHTIDARTNPQALQQAQMMADAIGGSINESTLVGRLVDRPAYSVRPR